MDHLEKIRNIGIIAHIDAGKTTTTERMLFSAGKSHRLGEVDDGNTVTDYLDEEKKRGITIVAAAVSFSWNDALVHLIDTPGHIDFTAEVERSMRVIDGAVVIFSAVEGVEAQSEKVWHQANRYHLPRVAFINKLDRIGASFDRVYEEIDAKFNQAAIPLQIPVGIEDQFVAVIDLIKMSRLSFFENDGTIELKIDDLDDDIRDIAVRKRTEMIEKIADYSDIIAELFLDGSEIGSEVLENEIKRLVHANKICPILVGSAKKKIGIQPLLDSIVRYLPSPADIKSIPAVLKETGEVTELTPDSAAPVSGIIFKIIAGASGDFYYYRSYTGTLCIDTKVINSRTGKDVKIQRILRLYAKNTESIDRVGPGDIVGLIGPRDVVTGDTICEPGKQVLFEEIVFPEPVLSLAIEPHSIRDKDRLMQATERLSREDPTLVVGTDENTGQLILAGMGELHLEVNTKRIRDEFNVRIKCGEPRVEYRETIAREIQADGVFRRPIGDTELFAEVSILLRPQPLKSETAFNVRSTIDGGTVNNANLKFALRSLTDGLKTGGNYGYPLIYISADLVDLKTDGERTTEGAILGAILQALNAAIKEAGTRLLEPVMKVEIFVMENSLGEVTHYLTNRRATIHDIKDYSKLKKMTCEIPLAEMFGFGKALPKLTGGRGSFSMDPAGYSEIEAP